MTIYKDAIGGDHQSPTAIVAASDSTNQGRADYICTGSADDVTIQSAIDASIGNVVFMPGIYLIESELNLKRGVSLIGENSFKDQFKTEGTVFKLNANVNMFSGVVSAFGDQHLKNCAIKNITLDGDDRAYSAIVAKYMHELTLSEVQFRDFLGDAIDATVCWDWRIRDCEFSYCGTDNTKHVIDLKCDANGNCNSWSLYWNRFEVNRGACMYFDISGAPGAQYFTKFKIIGNKFHGFVNAGDQPNISSIVLAGNTNVLIGNEFVRSKVHHIEVLATDTNTNTITGNTFETANVEDIKVGGNRNIITGNTFIAASKATTESNILLDAGANECVVSGNTNWDASVVPLVINSGGDNNHISNNPNYNPIGYLSSQPALPATGVTYTNSSGYACMVTVYGGTVSDVVVDGRSTGGNMGSYYIATGETISVAYSATPTWRWWGL